MNQLTNFIFSIVSFLGVGGRDVTDPLYNGITIVGPYAISIVAALSLIYSVFLGAKYAKCEQPDEKANLQKTLINFIIGAVTIVILISVLYAIRGPLTDWING